MTRPDPSSPPSAPDEPDIPLTSPDATPEQVAELIEIEAAAAERILARRATGRRGADDPATAAG